MKCKASVIVFVKLVFGLVKLSDLFLLWFLLVKVSCFLIINHLSICSILVPASTGSRNNWNVYILKYFCEAYKDYNRTGDYHAFFIGQFVKFEVSKII